MDHETFKQRFEEMGFQVAVDPENESPDGEKPVIVAANEAGDEIWWSVDPDTKQWALYFDLSSITLDSPVFRWEEVSFDDDRVVIEPATGTRSATTGYGRRGFDGTVQVDPRRTKIIEEHTSTYTN